MPSALHNITRSTMFITRCKSTYLILLLALVCYKTADAQSSGFTVDVITVHPEQAEVLPRLDLYARIPFTSLRFLTSSNGFLARFEVRAEFYSLDNRNRKRELFLSKTWPAEARANHFEATQTRELASITNASFHLEPGNYLLELYLEDLSSNDQQMLERFVEVRSFNDDIAVSDLILVHSYNERDQSISPIITDEIDTRLDAFNLFYEVYADDESAIRVTREVIRTQKSKGLPILRWFVQRWRGEDELGEITYASDESINLRKGRNPFIVSIPHNTFEVGEYLIRVKLFDEAGQFLAEADREVTLRSMETLEQRGRDIDDAIAQLKYIAKNNELKYIQEGETREERMERFKEFWEKRDPTPATRDVNEKMDEYYHRIDIANKNYPGDTPGWQTDRGHTLIWYGEPDQIDRSNANTNGKQPYEIWHYHRIGRRFVFIDRTGTGVFELNQPVWDN